jgi:ankyrin repeat protein
LQKLLQNSAVDVNAKDKLGETAIDFAKEEGRIKIVQLLCAKVDACDPLLEAANAGDKEQLKTLIANGEDVNRKNDQGTTALMGAAKKLSNISAQNFIKRCKS